MTNSGNAGKHGRNIALRAVAAGIAIRGVNSRSGFPQQSHQEVFMAPCFNDLYDYVCKSFACAVDFRSIRRDTILMLRGG